MAAMSTDSSGFDVASSSKLPDIFHTCYETDAALMASDSLEVESPSTQLSTAPAKTLPPELWDMVCDPLSRDELKNVSLTSRDLRPSAQRVLFQVIYLKLNLTSFANLIMISRSMALRHLVKHIRYTGRNWTITPQPFARTCTEWLEQHPDRNFNTIFKQEMEEIRSSDATRLVDEDHNPYGERYLKRNNNIEKLLEIPLASLPNLSHLSFDNIANNHTDHIHTWALLSTALAPSRYFFTPIRLCDLKELHLDDQDPDAWVKDLPIQVTFTALAKLQSLTLIFNIDGDIPPEFNPSEALSKLPSLRKLNITHIPDNDNLDTEFNLSRFFGAGQHWKKLENLTLDGFHADHQHLTSILATHTSSLRSLILHNTRLTRLHRDPSKALSWIDMFIFLNENMTLSNFSCEEKLWTRDGSMDPTRRELLAGYNEFWRAPHPSDYATMRPDGDDGWFYNKIVRYILRQGSCPFVARVAGSEPRPSERCTLSWTFVEDESFKWDEHTYEDALEWAD